MSKEAMRKALEAMSAEYRAALPARLAEIEQLGALATSETPIQLRRLLHTIAGSAATFGLPALTQASREAEYFLDDCCQAGTPLPQESQMRLGQLLEAVQQAAAGDA